MRAKRQAVEQGECRDESGLGESVLYRTGLRMMDDSVGLKVHPKVA